jgi:hypothetical protein
VFREKTELITSRHKRNTLQHVGCSEAMTWSAVDSRP